MLHYVLLHMPVLTVIATGKYHNNYVLATTTPPVRTTLLQLTLTVYYKYNCLYVSMTSCEPQHVHTNLT